MADSHNKERYIPSIPVVFFDLDDTLVPTYTDVLWAKFIARKNPLEFLGMRRFINLSDRYRQGILTGKDLADFQLFRARKYSVSRFRELADEFFRKAGMKNVYPDATVRIREHIYAGSTVVLITAQHELVAEPFARHFGMELIGNRFEIDGDRFTGKHILPYCFREGKLELAGNFLAEQGHDLKDCGFYTDSHNDIFMLEAVGHPFAVNPDPELESHARNKNWPILKWSLP